MALTEFLCSVGTVNSNINECTVYTKMYEFLCVTFFANEKGILFGRTIAENIEYADIPPCYKRAVKKVRDYARAN